MRNIQLELEREADKKGLQGEERDRYIGGAWQHITQAKARRDHWRHSREYELLAASGIGTVDAIRQNDAHPDHVYIKQGGKWYSLGKKEYRGLVEAAEEEEAERKAAERAEHDEKGRKAFERALARMEKEDAREAKRVEREAKLRESRERREAEAQRKMVQAVERAQYSEVIDIIRRAGGVKRSVSAASGKERNRGEYNMLPGSVRHRHNRGYETYGERGLTLDDAATEVSQHMPHLKIETGNDLVDFFERHQEVEARRRAAVSFSLGGAAFLEPDPAPAPIPPAPEPAKPAEPEPPAADWGAIFGEAQPLPKEEKPLDLFGAQTDEEQGKLKHSHRHTWEPWRNDFRYMRCVKCGHLARSTFGAGVSK